MTLIVTRITTLNALASLGAEWEALEESISPRTPFASPTWCTKWWSCYKRETLLTRDELNSYAIRDADGRLVCVAPMFITYRPGFDAMCARELQFFGADPNVTEVRGPICQPEQMVECVSLLTEQLKSDRNCDWIQWRGLRKLEGGAPWPADIVLNDDAQTVDYVLPLPDSWQALKSRLPRNIKESLRKCYNSLARDSHEFEIRVIERERDVHAALETFLFLHRTRANKDGTVSHKDVFKSESARELLRDYCYDAARRGRLRIFQMIIHDRVIATRIGFALGDELYLYYSGYDVEWHRYSVMTTLVAEAIQWAITNRFKLVNLSTGTDVSKTRWRPEAISYQNGAAIAPSLGSRMSFHLVDRIRQLGGL